MTTIWLLFFFASSTAQPYEVARYSSEQECNDAAKKFDPTPKGTGHRCIPAPANLNAD